jgi:hypothetical protein
MMSFEEFLRSLWLPQQRLETHFLLLDRDEDE